ncbi:MAG TPA: AarF/ABC1/UbiB kinase family protein [Acidimicrobiia bacterium]
MLVRLALGFLVELLRVKVLVPVQRRLLGHELRSEPYSRAEQLRLALEQLGATAIKLGQILSTRGDLVPPEYQTELVKLQDAAPSEPFRAINRTISAELGRPVEKLFARFERIPVSAASIGQAHSAILPDGAEVIVKVRRPGVVEQVELDLDIIGRTATSVSRYSATARRYDLVGLTREFADTLRAELDYRREAANADRFAANFAGDDSVRIPRVYHGTSTSRVLTLERLHGLKIDDLEGLDAAGIDRVRLANRAATVALKMILDDGFFHADPHPGNFFIEPTGRIGLIDFGMVGTVDAGTRRSLSGLVSGLAGGGSEPLTAALVDLGVTPPGFDRRELDDDIERLLGAYLGRPLGELVLGPLLNDLLGVVRRHRLRLPTNLALLTKTLAMCEGVAAQLDPSFRMSEAIVEFLGHEVP